MHARMELINLEEREMLLHQEVLDHLKIAHHPDALINFQLVQGGPDLTTVNPHNSMVNP